MSNSPRIAVIHCSATGTVHELARAIAVGAGDTGAEVRLRRVAELAPEAVVAANPEATPTRARSPTATRTARATSTAGEPPRSMTPAAPPRRTRADASPSSPRP